MTLARMAGFVEDLVSFAGGEPLVPEMDGKPGELSQFGREDFSFGGARAGLAGEMEGMTDDDGRNGKPPRQARQRTQVIAPVALAFQGKDRLRSETQFVGNRHADAFRADVESEIAQFGFRLQRRVSCQSA